MTDAEGLAAEAKMIAACDPGIRDVVRWLNEHGFETCDSGDGLWKFRCRDCGHVPGEVHDGKGYGACGRRWGKKVSRAELGQGCGLPFPHVFMQVDPVHPLLTEADRLARELRQCGVVVVAMGQTFGRTDVAGGAWIQATYDPVSESGIIELSQLNDATFRVARSSVRAEIPR